MYKKWIYNIKSSYQRRLFATNIIMFVLPFLLITILIVNLLITEANTRSNKSSVILMKQINEKLTGVFQEISYFSNIFYWDKELNSIISEKKTDDMYQMSKDSRIVENLFISNTYAFDTYRYGVTILGTNGKIYSSVDKENINDAEDITTYNWYSKASEKNGQIIYLPSNEVDLFSAHQEDTTVYGLRQMHNLISGRPIGIMAVSVKSDYFEEICSKLLNPITQKVIIADGKGKVIYATDPALRYASIQSSAYYDKVNDNYSGYFLAKVTGQKSQIVFVTNEMTGWKVIMYTPLNLVGINWNFVFIIIIFVTILYLIISLYMSYYTAKTISRPVRNLRDAMERLQKGDLTVRTEIQGNDEFGQLSSQFNRTVLQIGELLKALEQQEEKKRELEMQALQAQINPHFLYNTLASIRFMLEMDMSKHADEALIALVKLLKRTFSGQKKLVDISEEIDTVEHYLKLLKIRYNAQFSWDIKISNEIRTYKILKFVLQPLVENSISHGFSQKTEPGLIEINGFKTKEYVIISIEDNGVGGDIDYINQILNGVETKKHADGFNGIGMKNVHDRLQLFFGKKYGLTVFRRESGGVIVKLKIPLLK